MGCLFSKKKKKPDYDETIEVAKPHKPPTGNPPCCDNPPVLLLEQPSCQGYILDDFGGLRSYITGKPDPRDSWAAVVLIPDVFGCDAPLMRKLADKVASVGFFVVVPDFFDGKPFNPSGVPLMEWLKEHPAQEGFNAAKPVIQHLRSKLGFSAIGAAGFCWGAKVVAELAKHDYIKAAVLLHPSFVTAEDIKEAKCHIAILGAEHDNVSPPTLIKEFGDILYNKEVKSLVRIYSGVSHGWTIRYEPSDERARRRAEDAHKEMIDWLTQHLKQENISVTKQQYS